MPLFSLGFLFKFRRAVPKEKVQHRTDNGKPAATRGRKARGPTGAAQLPKEGLQMKGKRIAFGLVAGLLMATVPASGVASASRTSWNCYDYKDAEKAFAKKMNLARSSRDQGKMQLDKQLSKVARRHAYSMANEKDLFHSNMTRLGKRVTRWRTLGENVGMGGSVGSLHEAFMASPGHKANILYGGFEHMGVGTVQKNGTLYVTVVFEGANDPGTTLSPPRC
jgi:uncharacterized protein YkwD